MREIRSSVRAEPREGNARALRFIRMMERAFHVTARVLNHLIGSTPSTGYVARVTSQGDRRSNSSPVFALSVCSRDCGRVSQPCDTSVHALHINPNRARSVDQICIRGNTSFERACTDPKLALVLGEYVTIEDTNVPTTLIAM